MSDLVLRSSAATQVAIQSVVEYVRQALERLGDEETGQDLIEYAGVLVIVAAIVTALVTLNVPSKVSSAVSNALNTILK